HRMHERIYSIRADNDVVEFTAWKLRAIGKRSGQDLWLKSVLEPQQGEAKPKNTRGVYNQERQRFDDLPVYEMADLGHGARVSGPCLVEAETFTAYLKDGHNGEIDRHGNLVVTVD